MRDAGSRSCDDVMDAHRAGCLAGPVDHWKLVKCEAHYRVTKTSMLLAVTRGIGAGLPTIRAPGECVRYRRSCLHLGHA
jgi:hypothetical protein